MLTFSGYQLTEKIYESSKTLVYRGERSLDQMPVIIKILKNKNLTPRDLAVFRKQHTLVTSLNLPNIVQSYAIESVGNLLGLVLEDFGALSLKDYYKTHSPDLSEFFAIAIQITQILSDLHQQRVIHKDIKPANLVINPDTKQVKITDFSIASLLPKETQVVTSPNGLEGTLPYLSPEQTGRMNRGIDYRTDFYSLGVTFYQLLTKRLPFKTTDPLEMVHCHLARAPISPSARDPTIPLMLSEIVLKLMAKMAEDRYQSAFGLQHDLEICQQEWQLHQKINPFLLGQQDRCDRFQIPEKLYGREAEIERLLEAFDRMTARSTSEFMLVTGYSGIGKSSLVQEVYKPIVQRRGYFISGKFDQLQRNIPYSAIASAFQSLIRQLLTESEAQLDQWREKLIAALGANAQVLLDIVPELEQIIGSQPPIASLAATEAQNRFNRVFQTFIRVFCQPEHPMVIFLDDLQWADAATLRLIKVLLADEQTRHLFLIGAYRNNEVSASHPLMILLEELQQAGIFSHQITLAPLMTEHVTRLIAETLHSSAATIQTLADLVMRKTGGNPFFINEFLKTLYQENLLRFDFNQKDWQWNIADIEAIDITDNVVELMAGKLKKLPTATQQVLQFAACIGNRFDLKTLSTICSIPILDIDQAFAPAIQEGLIIPTAESQLAQTETSEARLIHFYYRFLHDRVQQAAYTLIHDSQKQPVHLQIGRLLFANMTPLERVDRVFELVTHFNRGQALTTSAEKIELARLNFEAGKKAKSSAAYLTASEYFAQARKNLAKNCWSESYDLAFALHLEQAEVDRLIGNFEHSKYLINLALTEAKSAVEKAELYKLLISIYTLQEKYDQAIQVGRDGLEVLGVSFPDSDLATALNIELERAKKLLVNQEIAVLVDKPEMQIPEKRAAAKLLMALGASTYYSHYNLWFLAVMKLVNISLEYGQIPESSYGYSEYGLILGSMLGDYRSGYEFGQLGLKISEKFNDQSEKCKVCLVIGGSVNHWVRPLKEDATTFMDGYQAGLESGELQFAGYNVGHLIINLFYQGTELESLTAKFSDYLKFTEKTKNQAAKDMIVACQMAIAHLMSTQSRDLGFELENLSEEQFLTGCRERSSSAGIGFYLIFKAQFLYLYDRPLDALQCIQDAESLLKYFPGCISLAAFTFYQSLILAALYSDATPHNQSHYWQQLTLNQQQLQVWAENCPENFLHQHLLVEAEIARLSGNLLAAIELYDQSIAAANANEFIQDCALANELAAKLWLARGKEKIAQPYLTDAYYHYQSWGAKAKLTNLDQRYPQLLQESQEPWYKSSSDDQTVSMTHVSSTNTSNSQVLDLATILKASQAISQEIEIDRLLKTLMSVVLESAGAQKGTLLLQKDNQLVIAAQAMSEHEKITVLKSVDGLLHQALPVSLIHYVTRTQKKLLIHDATIDPACATDPYVLQHQPKSILCFPIIYQGGLFGILYLENNQTIDAFTHDRLQVLSLLSSQIAVSLENATLYQTLQTANAALQESETRERDRALQLEQSLHTLQQTQAQLIQTEKISSLGQLVAGVAHEVNNPVSFISGNLQYAEGYLKDLLEHLDLYQQNFPPSAEIEQHRQAIDLDYLRQDLPNLISSMRLGTGRICEIMASLRTFSRVDVEKQPADLHEGLESTLLILQHRLKAQTDRLAIEVVKDYGELPLVNCYAGQLNQIFMNLLANAIDALEEVVGVSQQAPGEQINPLNSQNLTIRICTRVEDEFGVVTISDNGFGIPESAQKRLFVPFFTTKAAGKGTGLGLSLSYEIVTKNHNGQLTCVSEPEQGTTFLIKIPL